MKILILTNHQSGLYRFRRELLERLVQDGHTVYVSVPDGEFTSELKELGVTVLLNERLERRGTNPLKDLALLKHYKYLLKSIAPDTVLTYTIKPNVYGGYLCGKLRIPYIATVTGLGTSIENNGVMQKVTLTMYRKGLKKAKKVFFQNKDNLRFMLDHHIVEEQNAEVLPGSGVNISEHTNESYPTSDDVVIFTTIGRIMKDKGIREILETARNIKAIYPQVCFRLIGDYDEDDLKKEVEEAVRQGYVEYIPFQKDIKPYIRDSHAIIHASYHEGLSNVLLESAASGRPVIATDVPGCIETFEPGKTGISFRAKNTESLSEAIKKFLTLTHQEKEQMGKLGREKITKEFDRKIVIQKYIESIN